MHKPEDESRRYPVQENMRWQRIEWRIQYVGYVVLFSLVILGACGLFSKGFLSERQITSADGNLRVEYERFGLRDSNMHLTLRVAKLRGPHFTLSISGEEMDHFQIQSLQPQPLSARSEDNQLILTYAVNRQQAGATVWLGVQPKTYGRYPVTVTLNDSSDVQFTQWVYP